MAQEAKRDDDETTPGGDPPEEKDDVRAADGDGGDDGGEPPDGDDESTDDESTDDAGGGDDGGDDEHHAPSADIGTVGTRTLGIERYVQGAYLAAALILFWVIQKLGIAIWNQFTEPNTIAMTAGAAVAGLSIAYGLYRNPRVNKLTTEVAGELSKVTWPSRQETYTSTVVVIVTSIVAALYLGVWDFIWSGLTDLIYKV